MVILERQSKDNEIEKANKGKVVEYKTKETGSVHQAVTMLFSDRNGIPNTMLFIRFQVSSRNSASQAETDANLASRMQCPRNEQHDGRPLQRRYSRTCRESLREPS